MPVYKSVETEPGLVGSAGHAIPFGPDCAAMASQRSALSAAASHGREAWTRASIALNSRRNERAYRNAAVAVRPCRMTARRSGSMGRMSTSYAGGRTRPPTCPFARRAVDPLLPRRQWPGRVVFTHRGFLVAEPEARRRRRTNSALRILVPHGRGVGRQLCQSADEALVGLD